MASHEQRQEAHNRGQQFGQNARAQGQPRAVTQAMLATALGPLQADAEIRAAFDGGFAHGYGGGHGQASAGVMPPEEAQRRGWEAGQYAATNKAPRIPSNNYNALGPDVNEASQRQLFDQGFYNGYDTAAKGMGTVGPGGQTATSVLKKVTADEQKKIEDVFGQQQTMLAAHYDDLDRAINAELASYSKVDGGLQFIADWKLAKSEFSVRNLRQMSEQEINDSQAKLEDMKGRREGLIANATVKMAVPGILDTIYKPPAGQPTQPGTQPPPKPGGGAVPAGAGLFGLSRNATIGLALVATAAIGGGIYFATRDEEHEGMEKGPDGVWRAKPKLPALPPGR